MASLLLIMYIMLYGLVTSTLWVFLVEAMTFRHRGLLLEECNALLAHYAVCTRVTNGYIQRVNC